MTSASLFSDKARDESEYAEQCWFLRNLNQDLLEHMETDLVYFGDIQRLSSHSAIAHCYLSFLDKARDESEYTEQCWYSRNSNPIQLLQLKQNGFFSKVVSITIAVFP